MLFEGRSELIMSKDKHIHDTAVKILLLVYEYMSTFMIGTCDLHDYGLTNNIDDVFITLFKNLQTFVYIMIAY